MRLIRCLVGQEAIKAEKTEHGMPLVVLGLEVHVPQALSTAAREAVVRCRGAQVSSEGFQVQPAVGKAEKWLAKIQAALQANRGEGKLSPG